MSRVTTLVYFGVGRTLYVWDYSVSEAAAQGGPRRNNRQQARPAEGFHEMEPFDTPITAILELNCANSRAKWQLACDTIQDCRHIIVATNREVKLFLVKRDASYGKLIVQETQLQALEMPVAHIVMVEFEKNGRVFYGRQGGRVSELTFENTARDVQRNPSFLSSAQYAVMSHKKRLYRVDHQKDNILFRMIPALNFGAMTKRII